jgi:hypothetical protein
MSDPLGTLPARGGLIRTGTADLTGLAVVERERSGQKARKSRFAIQTGRIGSIKLWQDYDKIVMH